MKKRYLLIFIVIFFLVGMIAGCGSNNEDNKTGNAGEAGNNEQNSESNNEEQNDQGEDQEEVTIKFHTHGNEENYNWQETLAAFEVEYPHINVDLIILSEKGDTQEATQKLDLAAASGE